MIEQWNMKAPVVKKLTFLWAAFALYPICFCGAGFRLMRQLGGWVELLEGMGLSLPLALLAWGHFKGWRAAWWLGIALSLFWSVIALINVPAFVDFIRLFSSIRGSSWRSSTILFTILVYVLLASCSCLMFAVLFLSLSRAGRVAYGRPGFGA